MGKTIIPPDQWRDDPDDVIIANSIGVTSGNGIYDFHDERFLLEEGDLQPTWKSYFEWATHIVTKVKPYEQGVVKGFLDSYAYILKERIGLPAIVDEDKTKKLVCKFMDTIETGNGVKTASELRTIIESGEGLYKKSKNSYSQNQEKVKKYIEQLDSKLVKWIKMIDSFEKLESLDYHMIRRITNSYQEQYVRLLLQIEGRNLKSQKKILDLVIHSINPLPFGDISEIPDYLNDFEITNKLGQTIAEVNPEQLRAFKIDKPETTKKEPEEDSLKAALSVKDQIIASKDAIIAELKYQLNNRPAIQEGNYRIASGRKSDVVKVLWALNKTKAFVGADGSKISQDNLIKGIVSFLGDEVNNIAQILNDSKKHYNFEDIFKNMLEIANNYKDK